MDLASSVLDNYKRDSGEDITPAMEPNSIFSNQDKKLEHIRSKKGRLLKCNS